MPTWLGTFLVLRFFRYSQAVIQIFTVFNWWSFVLTTYRNTSMYNNFTNYSLSQWEQVLLFFWSIILWDHCLVKLTFNWHGCKARETFFYVVGLAYHYRKLFIEIKIENTSYISLACFIHKVTSMVKWHWRPKTTCMHQGSRKSILNIFYVMECYATRLGLWGRVRLFIWGICLREIPIWKIVGSPRKEVEIRLEVDKTLCEWLKNIAHRRFSV